jgi:hypothetical protein
MSAAVSLATRRSVLRLVAATAVVTPVAQWVLARSAAAAPLPPVAVWKDANCGCCNGWVEHMRKSGFSVTAHDSANMAEVKQANRVPEAMQSCHTALVDGYVIEGHVPAEDIKRLLRERPKGQGLAVPGMPASAPGMDQPGRPYSVILFGPPDGEKTYAQH